MSIVASRGWVWGDELFVVGVCGGGGGSPSTSMAQGGLRQRRNLVDGTALLQISTPRRPKGWVDAQGQTELFRAGKTGF